MFTIYVLSCQGNKYYVGKTERKLEHRVAEHFTKNGAEWTKMYPPLTVVEEIQTDDAFDEDKWTKKYMKTHGIENVRGGSYSTIKLSHVQMEALKMEFRGVDNVCFRCGSPNHFVNACPNKGGSFIQSLITCLYETFESNNDVEESNSPKYRSLEMKQDVCFRCGRPGHWVKDCYAKRHANGQTIT